MIGLRHSAIASGIEQGNPRARGWGDLLDGLNEFYRKILFLPEQASTVARPIDQLHYLEITVMFLVGAVIAAAVVFFLARYHHRDGSHAQDLLAGNNAWAGENTPGLTPHVTAPLAYEIGLYSGLFGLFVFFWVIGYRQYVGMLVPPAGAIDVFVTARQWVWQFAYQQGPATAGILYVPAGQPVRLVITSRDVIHSFFVPQFRIKRDAVPGLYTETWFEATRPGTYNVLCAELCGVGHSVMRAGVIVLDAAEFERWLGGRPQAAAEQPLATGASALAERGRLVAVQKGCLRCHSIDGSSSAGPTWRDLFGSWELLANSQRVFVDESYITRSMMEPDRDLVEGFPNIMPSFMGLVSPAEVSALIAYMRALSDAPGERQRDGRPGEQRADPAQIRGVAPAGVPAPAVPDTQRRGLPR